MSISALRLALNLQYASRTAFSIASQLLNHNDQQYLNKMKQNDLYLHCTPLISKEAYKLKMKSENDKNDPDPDNDPDNTPSTVSPPRVVDYPLEIMVDDIQPPPTFALG